MHHGQHVSLWLDDLASLQKLHPRASQHNDAQQLDGVCVRPWKPPFDTIASDDVVIEAFACELPEEVLATMASRPVPPRWINLEYLSAEAWIEGCHRMPSPHPRLALQRHFFFPGFTASTGGLLREPDLLAQRERFCADAGARSDVLGALLGRAPAPQASVISLFSYEQPALPALMAAWAAGDQPIELLVPQGRVMPDVARYFRRAAMPAGTQLHDRALSVSVIPFVDQDSYDRLLWACDINFVRGEDSFVRAQWAAHPFVWNIYRQAEDAHLLKLEAFLERFLAGAAGDTAEAVANFWRAWNGSGDPAAAWPAFAAHREAFGQHCASWSAALAAQEDLASALLKM